MNFEARSEARPDGFVPLVLADGRPAWTGAACATETAAICSATLMSVEIEAADLAGLARLIRIAEANVAAECRCEIPHLGRIMRHAGNARAIREIAARMARPIEGGAA